MKTLFVLQAAAFGNGKIAQAWGIEELGSLSHTVSFWFTQFNYLVWVENSLLDDRFMIYRICHIQSNRKGIHNDISSKSTSGMRWSTLFVCVCGGVYIAMKEKSALGRLIMAPSPSIYMC